MTVKLTLKEARRLRWLAKNWFVVPGQEPKPLHVCLSLLIGDEWEKAMDDCRRRNVDAVSDSRSDD